MEVSVIYDVAYTVESMNSIKLVTVYKPNPDCTGDLIRRECVFRIAMVRYPITIANNTPPSRHGSCHRKSPPPSPHSPTQ